MKFVQLVLKNLLRNRRRTVLTVLSIGVSLFIFSALISLPTVANQILVDTASSVRIATHNRAGLAYELPAAYQRHIEAIPHVLAVSPESWFGGIYHEAYDQFGNESVDPNTAEEVWPDWGVTHEQWERFRKLRTACLVGTSTMKRFNFHVGQQIMLRGTYYHFPVTLTIIGELKGKAPRDFLIFRRDYLEEVAHHSPFIDIFWLRVDKAENVGAVINAIDREFANSSAETHSESEASFNASFIGSFRIFLQMAEILGVVVIITIAFVCANTAAMTMRERRSEIAVMRVLGFTPGTVLWLLLGESVAIGLMGGAFGCSVGYLALGAFANAVPSLGGLPILQMPPQVVVETLVAAALIGILSALIPARVAAQESIVETLRAFV
jgi:putative ABC transport system permease protein